MDNVPVTDLSDAPEARRHHIASILRNNLIAFNQMKAPGWYSAPMVLAIEEKNRCLAGLIGRFSNGWLFIEILWVDEHQRSTGHGQALLLEAERIAQLHHCRGVHLDTFSFQAPDWYRRLGYELFGQIDDYPPGFTRYFFKKTFRNPQ